jgi:site-specific recombinase XerD
MMWPVEFGIILAAPKPWSTTIMTDKPKTCVDPYVDSFAQSFAAANYTAETIKTYRHLARKLGRLMDTAGIAPSALTPDLADQLARTTARGRDTAIRFHNLARRFAEHLIDIGVAQPVPLTEAQIARVALLADYETYLVKQRGLSPRTIYHVLRFADRFLDHRFGTGMIDLRRLRAADAIGFVQHLLTDKHPYRHKTATTHLRTFFQYLFGRGATASNLALSIPKAAKRRDARLPRHLSPDGLEAVLSSVRGNPRHGARDYAMLLLMARLGLRAPEVIAIQLDDIDWRAGELLVRGKGKLHDRLPITAEVGEALSRYLREERGETSCRTAFVTHRAPRRAFKDGQIVNAILKDALAATGQKPVTPYVGSHLLRHSLATRLVNAGASIDEVGDVLRHRSRASTMVYVRLDIDGLRSISQPWPVAGGVQ